VLNELQEKRYDFLGGLTLDTTVPRDGWLQKKTGTPPDIVAIGGALKVGLDSTSEAQINTAYMACTPWRLEDVQELRIVLAADTFGAGVTAAIGLVQDQADAQANLVGVFWKIDADNLLSLAVQDGTNADVETASGITLGTAYRELVLDMKTGVQLKDVRAGGSKGGRGSIEAAATNDNGKLSRVCRATIQDLSVLTGGVQLLVQIQKASGTATGALYVGGFKIDAKRLQASYYGLT